MTALTAAEVSQRARAFLAAVSVAPDVLELRPDYRVALLEISGRSARERSPLADSQESLD